MKGRSPARVYLDSRSNKRTATRYMHSLRQAARALTGCPDNCRCDACDPFSLSWHELEIDDVAKIWRVLRDKNKGSSPSSMNVASSALIGVVDASWQLRLMPDDRYLRVRAAVPRLQASTVTNARILEREDVLRVFAAALSNRDERQGARDSALVAAMLSGLRRLEAISVDMADVRFKDGRAAIYVRSGKVRSVPLPPHLAVELRRWVGFRGRSKGPFFFASDGMGHGLKPRRPTGAGVYLLCRRLASRAGIEPFSPNDLRATFAAGRFDAGKDISAIQEAMGHKDPSTTKRYDRRTTDKIRDHLWGDDDE